jgi:DNA primase
VRHAVATLGTATTAQHVQKLLRLVERVVFAFDGDAAGRRAAWRALEACLPHVADTKRIDFLFLPPEHDPDSFVRERGAEGFNAYLETAQPLSEFMLRELGGRVDLATPEGRARFQAEARPLLLAMPQAALRMQLVQSVAGKAGVRAEDLLRYLEADGAGGRSEQGSAARRDDRTQAVRNAGGARGGQAADAVPGDERFGAPQGARYGGEPGGGRYGPGGQGGGSDSGGVRWEPGGYGGRGGGGGYGGRRGPGERGGRWDGDRWGGDRDRWRYPPRPMPVELPDLERRARLLLSLHPALAREAWPDDFLPDSILRWIARLGGLAEGATFAALVESLRADEPALAAALEAEATRDRGLLAELEPDEARREFEGALNQLRSQRIRDEVDRLAAAGLADEAQRARYAQLQALRKALTSTDGS